MRYIVGQFAYINDSPLGKVKKDEVSEIVIVDSFNDNQVVCNFPIKVPRIEGKSVELYGLYINNLSLARKMAKFLCDQMNRESGY